MSKTETSQLSREATGRTESPLKVREMARGRLEIEVTSGPRTGEKAIVVPFSPTIAYFNTKSPAES